MIRILVRMQATKLERLQFRADALCVIRDVSLPIMKLCLDAQVPSRITKSSPPRVYRLQCSTLFGPGTDFPGNLVHALSSIHVVCSSSSVYSSPSCSLPFLKHEHSQDACAFCYNSLCFAQLCCTGWENSARKSPALQRTHNTAIGALHESSKTLVWILQHRLNSGSHILGPYLLRSEVRQHKHQKKIGSWVIKQKTEIGT